MIPRIIKDKIARSPKSVLLLGPRQVGKSTVCNALHPTITINLADERTYREHLRDVGLLARIVEAAAENATIFIDEIQRIPSMLNTIQSLIDSMPTRKFLMTGSSARKLKRGQANLLPGRIFVEQMSPLLFWELEENFSLERILQLGSLPEVYLQDYGPKLLESYVDTYLREEIQAEALTKDLGAYSRFLDLAAELSGQHLNYAKIASDAEIKKETVRRYFSILEDTLLVRRIPSYTDINEKRRARQKDRFIFFDNGVRNGILRKHLIPPTKSESGHLFEQWLILQVLSYSELNDEDWKITSFATTRDQEVDLVIETPEVLVAAEIKYRAQIDAKMAKNLNLLDSLITPSVKKERKIQKYVVYIGDHRQKLADDILGVSYKEFLGEIIPALSSKTRR